MLLCLCGHVRPDAEIDLRSVALPLRRVRHGSLSSKQAAARHSCIIVAMHHQVPAVNSITGIAACRITHILRAEGMLVATTAVLSVGLPTNATRMHRRTSQEPRSLKNAAAGGAPCAMLVLVSAVHAWQHHNAHAQHVACNSLGVHNILRALSRAAALMSPDTLLY